MAGQLLQCLAPYTRGYPVVFNISSEHVIDEYNESLTKLFYELCDCFFFFFFFFLVE